MVRIPQRPKVATSDMPSRLILVSSPTRRTHDVCVTQQRRRLKCSQIGTILLWGSSLVAVQMRRRRGAARWQGGPGGRGSTPTRAAHRPSSAPECTCWNRALHLIDVYASAAVRSMSMRAEWRLCCGEFASDWDVVAAHSGCPRWGSCRELGAARATSTASGSYPVRVRIHIAGRASSGSSSSSSSSGSGRLECCGGVGSRRCKGAGGAAKPGSHRSPQHPHGGSCSPSR